MIKNKREREHLTLLSTPEILGHAQCWKMFWKVAHICLEKNRKEPEQHYKRKGTVVS